MELIVKDSRRNDLLKRQEIIAVIKSEITPVIEQARKAVAESLHADAELVAMRRVKGRFGRKEFDVEACVYDSKEAFEGAEPKPKEKKQGQAEKAEEKPERKEEQKPEAKQEKTGKKEGKAEQKEEAKEIKQAE